MPFMDFGHQYDAGARSKKATSGLVSTMAGIAAEALEVLGIR
jgi:hypothetical protein